MRLRLKNVAVVAIALLLATLGVYNIFLKATWTLMDDGVFWRQGPQGMTAGRVAAGGPAALAGVRPLDASLRLRRQARPVSRVARTTGTRDRQLV